VLNNGNGVNFGGTARYGAMTVRLVRRCIRPLPAISRRVHAGHRGTRVYISGDTDLYGDMKMLGERYQPISPSSAWAAVRIPWAGRSGTCLPVARRVHAIPVPLCAQRVGARVEAGEEFRRAAAQIARRSG